MKGFFDLLQSERGVFCILTLLSSLVLVVFGQMTIDQWIDFVKYLTGFLVASKTLTTAVETYTLKKPQISDPQTPEARVVTSNKE
jgi:hypothetical protein